MYAVDFAAPDLSLAEQSRLDDLLAGDGRRDLADDLTLAGWGEFFSLAGTFEAFAEDFVAPLAERLRTWGFDPDA
jgi:hypothetical protein